MNTDTLQSQFLALDDREAILRSAILYRPNGVLTRSEREKRLPNRDDLRETYGVSLERDMWDYPSASGFIEVPRGKIVSNVFFHGEGHRAWMMRLKLETLARLAVKQLPKGFEADLLGDDLGDRNPLILWLVAVHVLTKQKRIQRTLSPEGATIIREFPTAGFPSEKCFSLVDGIGAASAEAMQSLSGERPPKVNGRDSEVIAYRHEARDAWLNEQAEHGVWGDKLRIKLDKEANRKNWEPFGSRTGVNNAVNEYRKRHGLPPLPSRKRGSPPKKTRAK